MDSVKKTTYGSPLSAEKEGERSSAFLLLTVLIEAVAALLLPRATIGGTLSPFGVGLSAAVMGIGSPVVYMAAVAGYVWTLGIGPSLRYVAAVVATVGFRWALTAFASWHKTRWFVPLTAGFSVMLSGVLTLALNQTLTIYPLLMALCEAVAAAGFAFFCRTAITAVLGKERHLSYGQQASLCAVGAMTLAALATVEIYGISPGRLLAVLPILVMARIGRESGGATAGAVVGAAMALVFPDRMFLCAVYAFGGLLAGQFCRFGRVAAATAFLAAAGVICLGSGDVLASLTGLYEVAGGALLFAVMPPRWDKALHFLFQKEQEWPAVESFRRSVTLRLDVASRAMQEVAQTVDAVSSKLASVSAPDLGSVYREACDGVCRGCGLRLFCWETHFDDTMDSLNHFTPLLREHGQITPEQVEGHLLRRCGRLPELTRRVSSAYEEHLLRESAWRRLSEIRRVLTGQFVGVGEMLKELSDSLGGDRRMDTEIAYRMRHISEAYGLSVRDVLCFWDARKRLTVEILTDDEGLPAGQEDWIAEMSEVCGRTLDIPLTSYVGRYQRLTLREKPRFRVNAAATQLTCRGERLCGDAYELFTDDSGCFVAVLSDGMGSGGRAAVDGAMAAGLTARLLKAGLGEDSVLQLVNTALMVKAGEESLATLDVLRLDPYTGRAESLKAGAAASLLMSKGRLSRWEQASLPAGILSDIRFERQQDTLTAGDVLLLVSDGVYSEGCAWVETCLAEQVAQGASPAALARAVAEEAQKRQTAHPDDITVLAIMVEK